MIQKLIRRAVEQVLPGLLAKVLVDVVKLDKDSQYLIAVESDEVAKDLISVMENHFDLSQGPRFIVIPARDFRVLEISKKIGNPS